MEQLTMSKISDYIKQKPFKAIGYAVAIPMAGAAIIALVVMCLGG
jgi:hypothetical protein